MQTKGNIQDIYPLTPMQEGMLFHALADSASSAYFEQMSYRLHGELDIEIVKKSLTQLFKRYDILRTAFIHEGLERPMQVVLKERECGFFYQDIANLQGDDAKETFVRELKEKDRLQHFNLSRDVLMRVAVLKLREKEYEFTWSNHHILMDGWCIGILISDFFEIYNSYLDNRPWRLPEVKPYRNYILWLEKQDRKESKNYWKKYLEGYEETASIPTLKPANPLEEEEYRVNNVPLILKTGESEKLNQLMAAYHVTLNTIVQTLWGILLGRYVGRQDVVFGSVVSGRPPEVAGVESMVGLFVNTIPVRVAYDDQKDITFSQLLKRTQENALAGEPYHYHPLAEIQSETALKQQLLDHLLVFENFPVADQIDDVAAREEEKGPGVSFQISATDVFEQTNYNFDLVIIPGKQLRLKFAFNECVYDVPFIERMAGYFYHLVRQVMDEPEKKTHRLVLITDEEKKQLVTEFNNTTENYPGDRSIHQLMEDQAVKTPGRTAVFYEGQKLTYRETNEQANQLARRLKEKGIVPGQAVGMILDRSVDMVVGMLAVLKTGGAFVPVDPDEPEARNEFILEENQTAALLTHTHWYRQKKTLTRGYPADAILLMDDKKIYNGDMADLETVNQPGDVALVLYTSGTTGKPKGILLEHRNVNHYIHGLNQRIFSRYENEAPLHIGLQAPFTFDGFAQIALGAMWYGHTAYILPNEHRYDGAAMLKYFSHHRIHITDGAPAHLRLMVESLNGGPPDRGNGIALKNLLIAGEVLPRKTAADFLEHLKHNPPTITNCYGPTECCGDSTMYPVTQKNVNRYTTLPIGVPMPNEQIYIVDKHMQLQPIGVWGEICIGGEGVARGYLNNPELTAEKFNRSYKPYRTYISYKTGDLGRWMPNGNVEFSGRIDQQVKIRGYRIEPEEVSKQLLNHEDIIETTVIAREDRRGDFYLCAYYVSTRTLELSQLRQYLSKYLPAYMIPSYFVPVDKIPRTPRGKVDEKALPEPEGAISTGKTYVPPANETERKIVSTWSEVLGIDPHNISTHDDYNELGGNSINIINVLNRLNKEFEHPVSLSFLILYPTVKELAANIHEQGILSKLECVVKLNRGGNEKNIFIIHPMNGQVYIYKDLAKLLEDHYNMYGLQARGIVRRSRLAESFSEMVEDYIYQIRFIQPEGPYIIMGHCIGDVIAYLLVKRMEEMKCKVERLIMSDEHAFVLELVLNHSRRKDRIKALFTPFTALGELFKKKENRKTTVKSPYKEYDETYNGEPEIFPEESEQMKNKVHFHIQKLNRHYFSQNIFKIIDGIIKAPILDIKAKDTDERLEEKELKKMTFGSFTLAESDGEHFTMFQKPHVYQLAEVMKNMDKICEKKKK